jgi:hypothetical protein
MQYSGRASQELICRGLFFMTKIPGYIFTIIYIAAFLVENTGVSYALRPMALKKGSDIINPLVIRPPLNERSELAWHAAISILLKGGFDSNLSPMKARGKNKNRGSIVYLAFHIPEIVVTEVQGLLKERLPASIQRKILWCAPKTAHATIALLGLSDMPYDQAGILYRKKISDNIMTKELIFPLSLKAMGTGIFENGGMFIPIKTDSKGALSLDRIDASHKKSLPDELVTNKYPYILPHVTFGYLVEDLGAAEAKILICSLSELHDRLWMAFEANRAFLYHNREIVETYSSNLAGYSKTNAQRQTFSGHIQQAADKCA